MQKKYNEQKIREDYRRLTLMLIEKNISITTMESCTSGQVASLISDTEGASGIMKGAFVTYSNEAKIKQGVPEETIIDNNNADPASLLLMSAALMIMAGKKRRFN